MFFRTSHKSSRQTGVPTELNYGMEIEHRSRVRKLPEFPTYNNITQYYALDIRLRDAFVGSTTQVPYSMFPCIFFKTLGNEMNIQFSRQSY